MSENLREKIVRRLRAEIIAGHMPPRTMYSAPNLAESLKVSTTPVREALLELARIGLMKAHRNRGFEVLEPTADEINQIFETRELLEVYALQLALERGPVDLKRLQKLAKSIEKSVNDGDFRTYIESDREFHRQIALGSRNDVLVESITTLKDRMRLFGLTTKRGRDQQVASIKEHFEIIDLIACEQSLQVTELLRAHIRVWQPIYLQHLQVERSLRSLGLESA